MTYLISSYNIHVLHNGKYAYIAVAESSAPLRTCFLFLAEMEDEHSKNETLRSDTIRSLIVTTRSFLIHRLNTMTQVSTR